MSEHSLTGSVVRRGSFGHPEVRAYPARMTARPATVAALPAAPGVYRFRDAQGRAVYLGRATDLRARVGSYWGDLRDRPHLRRMVPQVAGLEAVPCVSVHEATWLERNLLERSRPRWNRIRGGLEVPTWIALLERSGTAELRVVHSPADAADAPVFGPYLGGGQSRLAAAGIDRVLSLSYAGARRSGFDRDMARVRGVADADLTERVGRARAVLAGVPDAVAWALDALARRRGEAAGACAFEVAQRIQAELEALSWVTAPQRVTTPDATLGPRSAAPGPTTRVHGHADGVLVTFEVRAGRLDGWRQTLVDAPPRAGEERPVETAPASLHELAQQAARLAARLRDAG